MELAICDAFRKAGVEEEKAKAIAENLNANFNTTVSKGTGSPYARMKRFLPKLWKKSAAAFLKT